MNSSKIFDQSGRSGAIEAVVFNATVLTRFSFAILTLCVISNLALDQSGNNLISVGVAAMSCALTAFLTLRPSVLAVAPFSSLIVLTFCLTTTGLPLILLPLQGQPLIANLEVPVETFTHLAICQCVLLACHAGVRNSRTCIQARELLRRRLLEPLGVMQAPPLRMLLALGAIGLSAAAYVYIVLREQQGGDLAVTGSALNKLFQALVPLMYSPFLLLLGTVSAAAGLAHARGIVTVALYFVPVLLIAIAFNARVMLFVGFATAASTAALMTFTGAIRLRVTRRQAVIAILLLPLGSFASDVALAMRVARHDRQDKSGYELVVETIDVLTARRDELDTVRETVEEGEDRNDAWYVRNAVLGRLVATHYQDQSLAIALELGEREGEFVRQLEVEKVITTLPNPLLVALGSSVSKDEVGGNSMGDWMQYLGGRKGLRQLGGHGTGGFIGDGFLAFGWWYIVIFGLCSCLLFLMSDALCHVPDRKHGESQGGSALPVSVLGMVYSYSFATCLTAESVAGLVAFLIRQPVQWLALYVVACWVARGALSILPSPPEDIAPLGTRRG